LPTPPAAEPRGRDAEELNKLCEFDPDTGTWSITADYDDNPDGAVDLMGLRADIADMLKGSPRPLKAAESASVPTARCWWLTMWGM
jgi:hypothetical protein